MMRDAVGESIKFNFQSDAMEESRAELKVHLIPSPSYKGQRPCWSFRLISDLRALRKIKYDN